MIQLKTYCILTFYLVTLTNISSQDAMKWKLADSTSYGIEELIDSIWMEVVSWDNDTSHIAANKREKQASDLEEYSRENQSKVSDKASLYSYFIRFRNSDYEQIISKFEHSKFEYEQFKQIYPIYSSSVQGKYEQSQVENRLNSLADQLSCQECKVLIWSDLGRTLFYKNRKDDARMYFQKVVSLSYKFELIDTIDIRRAKSFIRKIDHLNIGDPMIPFQAKDIYGEKVILSREDKKVTLIDFWATWCRPCVRDLPTLKSIFEKHGKNPDFRMIGVSLDKERSQLEEFITQEDISWTQIYEKVSDGNIRDGDLANLYNGYALPTYYLIDKDGIIRYNFEFGREGIDLEKMVDQLMKQ